MDDSFSLARQPIAKGTESYSILLFPGQFLPAFSMVSLISVVTFKIEGKRGLKSCHYGSLKGDMLSNSVSWCLCLSYYGFEIHQSMLFFFFRADRIYYALLHKSRRDSSERAHFIQSEGFPGMFWMSL